MRVIQRENGNGFNATFAILMIFLFFLPFTHASAASDKSHKKISALSNQIIRGYKSIQKPKMERIAVVDFTTLDGNPSETGHFIAEQMSLNLSKETHFLNNQEFPALLFQAQ